MRGSDFGAFVRRSEEVYGLDVVSSGSWLPSLATGVFRAATGVAAAPQRGANPPFATGAGSGEAPFARCKDT